MVRRGCIRGNWIAPRPWLPTLEFLRLVVLGQRVREVPLQAVAGAVLGPATGQRAGSGVLLVFEHVHGLGAAGPAGLPEPGPILASGSGNRRQAFPRPATPAARAACRTSGWTRASRYLATSAARSPLAGVTRLPALGRRLLVRSAWGLPTPGEAPALPGTRLVPAGRDHSHLPVATGRTTLHRRAHLTSLRLR